jgi:hypothetical protein
MPPFEHLLPPEDDDIIQDLLFTTATLHALDKSRLHTDHSLEIMRRETAHFGGDLRRFANDVSSHYDTKELPKETSSRARAVQRKATAAQPPPTTAGEPTVTAAGLDTPALEDAQEETTPANPRKRTRAEEGTRKRQRLEDGTALDLVPRLVGALPAARVEFSMKTIKLHAIGHHPDMISRLGPSDNASTQVVCSVSMVERGILRMIQPHRAKEHIGGQRF